MRRRSTMYLDVLTAGTLQPRREMLAFVNAHRDAGVKPPRTEAPDHPPVVPRVFAATVDPEAGRHADRAPCADADVLCGALADAKSPYEYTVAAICETLPAATNQKCVGHNA